MSQPYPVVMLMVQRPTLGKVIPIAILMFLVLSMVPVPTGALEVSEESNVTDNNDWDRVHRIAVDTDGNYHLVYNEVGDDDFVMHRKVSPTGETLAGPTKISPSNIDSSYDSLAISVDSSDRVHIAYHCQATSDDARNVYYTQLAKDGSINVDYKNVAPSEDAVNGLDIDSDGSGNAYIVFSEMGDPSTIQWMKISPSGAVSKQPKEISGELGFNGDVQYPRLGVSSLGVSYVAWQQQDNQFSQVSLYYSQLSSTGTVEIDPIEVVSSLLYDLIYLEAASDRDGDLHLLFTENTAVHWAVIDEDGNLDSDIEVASSLLGQTAAMDIEVAPNDDVAITYLERVNIINAPWLPYIRIYDSSEDDLRASEILYDGKALMDFTFGAIPHHNIYSLAISANIM